MKELVNVKELLVVVDVINGFIKEGNMKDEYINRIVPGIKKEVEKYLDDDFKEVFYIRDCHNKDSLEFKKFPLHCLKETSESEMVDELKVYQDKVRTYFKNSTSAIFAPGLLDDINSMSNLEKVVIVGCCSDICVINFAIPLTNYFDQINKDVSINVIEELIETYDSNNHSRDEYNLISKKLLLQAGIKLI